MARRWQYPSYTEPVLDEAQRPEAEQLDKWWQPASEPQRLGPTPWLEAATELVLDEAQRAETVMLDKWWRRPTGPEPLPLPLPWLEPASELILDELQRPEAEQLDKWWREADNPLPAPPSSYFCPWADYRVELGPEIVLLDKWWRQPSEPQWQPPWPWLESATELVLDEAQRPEATTLDKWWREPDNPLPVPPNPYYCPCVTYHMLGPEVILLDKWWVEQDNPVLPLPRAQSFFSLALLEVAVPPYVPPAFVFDECQTLWEIIYPSSWGPTFMSSEHKEIG